MQEIKGVDKLSSRDYWDEILLQTDLPRICTPRSYHQRITMNFIDDFIVRRNYKTLFEVGCGSSGWLPYFAKKYNLCVSGIDYSEAGCRLAEKNMSMLGIPYDEIVCKDIFEFDWANGKKYDIIFSYGVIEHFNDPGKLISIFSELLNPGGLMISLVPNLNGLMGSLSKLFVKDVFEMHRVITRKEMQQYHQRNGLCNLKTSFAGTFTLSVLPLIKSRIWLYRPGTRRRRIVSFCVGAIDKMFNNFFKLTGINIPSRYFSPYIISVAQMADN